MYQIEKENYRSVIFNEKDWSFTVIEKLDIKYERDDSNYVNHFEPITIELEKGDESGIVGLGDDRKLACRKKDGSIVYD